MTMKKIKLFYVFYRSAEYSRNSKHKAHPLDGSAITELLQVSAKSNQIFLMPSQPISAREEFPSPPPAFIFTHWQLLPSTTTS